MHLIRRYIWAQRVGAMKKRIGLYVLCFLLLVFCVVLGLWYRSEGFANKEKPAKGKKVPAFCKTYGYGNIDILDPKKLDTVRRYTKADCDALGGVLRNGGWECLQLRKKPAKKNNKKKKKSKKGEEEEEEEEEEQPVNIDPNNIKRNYSTECAGLNAKKTTTTPEICYVDTKFMGTPNVEFKLKYGDKVKKIPANRFIVYTEEECSTLEGNFINFNAEQIWRGATKKSINEAMKLNGGTDVGVCVGSDHTFSTACTGKADLTNITSTGGVSSAFSSMLQYIKSFL